jgi:hypothetical protein
MQYTYLPYKYITYCTTCSIMAKVLYGHYYFIDLTTKITPNVDKHMKYQLLSSLVVCTYEQITMRQYWTGVIIMHSGYVGY